eukprot:TRINITY_DN302_c0_g1_i3.p1 TRINITY_DN302_c0_g1~~TRINITY_DN302_c0_g1_i3.p1  ORF type:complete len:257 (+),score=8.55 TRINITY_DN302_c0_g1_i3:117-773(+)
MVEKRTKEAVTREYTINLHKRLHGITFKKKAPRAVKEVRKFASKAMGTSDVRLDVNLNKALWSKGIRNVPNRLRIQISRRRNEDEDAKEDTYAFVTVPKDGDAFNAKGLVTQVVDEVQSALCAYCLHALMPSACILCCYAKSCVNRVQQSPCSSSEQYLCDKAHQHVAPAIRSLAPDSRACNCQRVVCFCCKQQTYKKQNKTRFARRLRLSLHLSLRL